MSSRSSLRSLGYSMRRSQALLCESVESAGFNFEGYLGLGFREVILALFGFCIKFTQQGCLSHEGRVWCLGLGQLFF